MGAIYLPTQKIVVGLSPLKMFGTIPALIATANSVY